MTTRAALAVFAFLALAAMAGCGGGNDSPSSSSSSSSSSRPTITKAGFVKQATLICEEGSGTLRSKALVMLRQLEKRGESGGRAAVLLVPSLLVPTLEAELDKLRALGVPNGEGRRLRAFYESLEGVIKEAQSSPRHFLFVQGTKSPYRETVKLATAYGIPRCGQP